MHLLLHCHQTMSRLKQREDFLSRNTAGTCFLIFGHLDLVCEKKQIQRDETHLIWRTPGGFETALVGMKEIGTLFLETCTALNFFGLTTVTSFMVIGFEAVGTHVTGPEKPRETGDDIIVAFLVEQNELFGEGPPITFDVVGAVCVDQKDLVVVEG